MTVISRSSFRRWRPRRLLLAAGLALAVLAPAALSRPAADAQPPPISPLQVRPGGTEVTISFTTAEPSYVVIANEPAVAAPNAAFQRDGGLTLPPSDPNAPPATVPDRQVQATGPGTTHEVRFTGLTSNTGYTASVTAVPVSQPAERFHGSANYSTQKLRVRLTLESIDIYNDGDGLLSGDGEPVWSVGLRWEGMMSSSVAYAQECWPNDDGGCKVGSYSEGQIVPRNSTGGALMFVFPEENFHSFPSTFVLEAWAGESDGAFDFSFLECITGGGCAIGESAPIKWQVPQGVESATETIRVHGDDAEGGFESVLTFSVVLFHDNTPYPAARNRPHSTWR